MAKTETIKKALEKSLKDFKKNEKDFNRNHRTVCLRIEQALQALERVIKDENIQALQGKDYFEATTPITGKTELSK
jgi:hypothetical protein